MNTALEYSTRVVQEGGRRCKKSTLNDLVHLTPLRIPLMNPPYLCLQYSTEAEFSDVIGTKVLRVFLIAIHSHLYYGFYPPPLLEQKWFETGL